MGETRAMTKVNYTYGILTGGVVPQSSPWYRKCIGVTYTCKKQQELLSSLFSDMRNVDAIGCSADMLIKLLECSEYYSDYLTKYDPVNTYTDDLPIPAEIPDNTLDYESLLTWTDNVTYRSDEYPVSSTQPGVVRIVNTLLSVLTLKG